jgi:hypothetical protein
MALIQKAKLKQLFYIMFIVIHYKFVLAIKILVILLLKMAFVLERSTS